MEEIEIFRGDIKKLWNSILGGIIKGLEEHLDEMKPDKELDNLEIVITVREKKK